MTVTRLPNGCTVDSAGRLWVHCYRQGGDDGGGNGVFCPETRVTAQAAPPSGGGRARKRSSEWLALRREAWGWYYENLSIDVIEDYLQNEIASQDRNDAKRLLDWLLDYVVKTIEADGGTRTTNRSTLVRSGCRWGLRLMSSRMRWKRRSTPRSLRYLPVLYTS